MNNASILVVDDDKVILQLLKKFLSNHHFNVYTALSVMDAVALINDTQIDLIILDIMLPTISGLEFAKNLTESGSHIPVIMLTALSEKEDKEKGLKAGATEYIEKPFDPTILLDVINKIINKNSNLLE